MCGQAWCDPAAEVASGKKAQAGIGEALAVFVVCPVGIAPDDTVDLCAQRRLDLWLWVFVIGNQSVIGGKHIDMFEPTVLLRWVPIDKTDGRQRSFREEDTTGARCYFSGLVEGETHG